MKKSIFILGGIALVCFLLIVRLFFRQSSSQEEEREWFAKSLGYEFSAEVDSLRMFNEHTGKLWCHITEGNPNVEREDSLKPFFKNHDKLYLIFRRSGDSIVFIVPNGNQVKIGDSVRISSGNNLVQFFRDGQLVANESFSNTLTGFGRPFFLKKK